MKRLFRTTALAALLLAGLPSAQAAIQNYDFNGSLESGAFANQGFTGSFSFDDAGLLGSGSEWLAISSLSMNLLGTTYTLDNALAPSEVAYFDGSFVGLSYSNATGDPLFSLIAGGSNQSEAYIAYDTTQGLSGTGNLNFTTAVPEPESYAMFLAGLGLMGLAALRRSKQA